MTHNNTQGHSLSHHMDDKIDIRFRIFLLVKIENEIHSPKEGLVVHRNTSDFLDLFSDQLKNQAMPLCLNKNNSHVDRLLYTLKCFIIL